jgi:glycosyltransferase involved in cell wall biosynthesis
LKAEELPTVGIVTLTRNRPKWFTNMAQNVLKTDYPTEKLTWVVVDDGDNEKRVDEQILKFQQSAPQIRVKYISLVKPLSVGAKRNKGCAAAIEAGAEVLVMMDDDDHYPKSSVEARVTYLNLMGIPCVYCARLPMYDCRRYISAMNVPPLYLAPAERVSEASLAFTREFWAQRPFPEVSVAEGEGFVAGREAATSEIVPEGVIVSFLHGKNHTARHVPETAETKEPNGCHYGFSDEFFMYLCDVGA